MEDNQKKTRQERRERKLLKKKEQVRQHGKGLADLYRSVVLKRLGGKSVDKK